MTMGNPAQLAEFAGIIDIESVFFDLVEPREMSRHRGGKISVAILGLPYWRATVTLRANMSREMARKVRGLMRRVGATGHFLMHNPAALFPINDPNGVILGNANVTISQISGRQIRLAGLPSGYELHWGDMLSVVYSGRRALFEVAEDLAANGAGTTPLFDVSPPPRAGMAAGNAVDLTQPAARMMFESYNPGISEGLIANGLTFNAIEVQI